MGKIRKHFSQEKHGATLSTFISRFIQTAESLPLFQLRSHLSSFPNRWPFSRGDLYHWIEVLNRFDGILEQFNAAYGLNDGPQTRNFTREILLRGDQRDAESESGTAVSEKVLDEEGYSDEGDRELVEEILTFTTLLFENCGNRSLYASSNRLTGLLNTISLSLLEATLRLGYRLAQRYTASRLRMGGPQYHLGPVNQSLLSTHFDVDVWKVVAIAQPISRMGMAVNQEAGLGVSTFPAIQKLEKVITDAVEGRSRHPPDEYKKELENLFQPSSHEENDVALLSSATEVSSSIPVLDLLKDLLGDESSEQFTILNHVRTARALHGPFDTKVQMFSIRLLALANLFQIWPEEELQKHIFDKERALPRRLQLPQLLCDLINPANNTAFAVPKSVQSLAFVVLESLTHHKSKSSEVCTALNINVSHGILATIVRKAVNEITSEQTEPETDEDVRWLDNLFVLLHALPKASGRAVDGLVSAGLVDMLLEVVSARTRKAERNQAIAVNFLSAFVYNTKDAFDALINNQGLDAISELLSHEIELSLSLTQEGKGMPADQKTKMNDYEVPFIQQQCLRALFKFVNSMLNISGGPIDRLLRNLVESSHVLTGLRTVLAHPAVYGSNVWTGAINIFSNFINNEPTSYAAIAEAGLTKSLLETVTQKPIPSEEATNGVQETSYDGIATLPNGKTVKGILPACESIHALPDAFGAICLNEAGMSQFETSGALETFFGIFTSPPHAKVLNSSSGSEIEHLGQSFDQLARHHPRLKPKIVNLVTRTADRVARLVMSASSNGLVQDEIEENTSGQRTASPSGDVEMKDAGTIGSTSDDVERSSTATSVYISVYSKFLSSLFRNTSMCGTFAEKGGVESVLAYATATKPPFSASGGRSALPCSHRLSRVVHILAEQKPHLMLPALISLTQEYADKLQPLAEHRSDESFLAPFVIPAGSALVQTPETAQRTEVVRALEPLQMLCDLLARSFTPSRATAATSFVSINMADLCIHLIDTLSVLINKLLLEKQRVIELPGNEALFMSYEDIRKKQEDQAAQSNGDTVTTQNGEGSNAMEQDSSAPTALNTELVYAVSNTAFSVPDTIRNLFQSIAKALLPRRMPSESYAKQSMMMVADHIAQALIDQLSLENPFNATPEAMIAHSMDNTRAISQVVLPSQSPYDDGGRTQVRTAVLLSFKEKGGLALLGAHIKTLFEQSVAPQKEGESEQKCRSRQLDADHGFRNFLEMFAQLVDQKTIQEAPQTGALTSRPDRDRDKPDYFSPAQFQVELRYQVIKAVSGIWASQDLEKAQSGTVRVLSDIIQSVLEGVGENGAFQRADKVPPRVKANPKKWRPRNDQVQTLEERDFESDLVREALYRCGDSLQAAEEYCNYYHNHPERKRHPIPAAEVQANPPVESNGSHQRPSQESNASASTEEPRAPTPLPSVNELTSGIPSAQTEDSSSQPTAFIDALSDIARTILQDPENSPLASDPSASLPAPNVNEANLAKAEDVPEVVTVEQLDEQRAEIREDLMSRCLSLLGTFDDVVFEMAAMITASVKKASDQAVMRQEIGGTLVLALASYQGSEDSQADAKKVTAIAHLLGLILQEKEFFEAAQESLKDSFPSLLGFLDVRQITNLDEQAPWIPQVLLIVERTLSEDMLPHQIRWEPPSPDQPAEEQPIGELPEPMVSAESKSELFNHVVDMLGRVGKNASLGLALVRVLVTLTRNRECATTLTQKRHMQRFLLLIKQLSTVMTPKLRSAIVLVLRNIVEDDETIRQLIRSEIRQTINKSTRPMETSGYVRTLYHCVLRAPEIFLEVTNELLELTKFDRNQIPQSLTLKKTEIDERPDNTAPQDDSEVVATEEGKEPTTDDTAPTAEKAKVAEIKPPVVEKPDGVVHYLLSELLAYKDVEDKKPSPDQIPQSDPQANPQPDDSEMSPSEATEDDGSNARDKKAPKEHFKPEEHPIYVYRCFILQCLTELLSSYNRTKVEFINFSRKADPLASTPSKPRSGVLNYLLNALLPTGTLQQPSDSSSRKKSETSASAIKVIVALCARTAEHGWSRRRDPDGPEEEPELLFVRRFVLEHALKAFKDANSSSESVELKYSKLLSISSLFDSMLGGKPISHQMYGRGNDARDANLGPTHKELAKIMLEKNFISALTGCMSEVDHTVPGSERLVKHMLRPMKLLTQRAIDLSLTSDFGVIRGGLQVTDEDEFSSASSVSDMDHGREETPDLYRNSTLGMFEPGREDESSSESEDEDDEDEIYADEMDYDEAEHDHGDGEVISDEDEDMEGVGPIEGLSGDIGMDIEVEIDDNEEVSDEDEDEEDDEDSELDDEGDDSDMDHDDDDVEIMEEVTGDDENDSLDDPENGDGDHWEPSHLEHEHLDGFDFGQSFVPVVPAFDGDESHSDGEDEPNDDLVADEEPHGLHEHLEMHMDADEDAEQEQVVEEFSAEEDEEFEEGDEDEAQYHQDFSHMDDEESETGGHYTMPRHPHIWGARTGAPHRDPVTGAALTGNRAFLAGLRSDRDRLSDPWRRGLRNGGPLNDDNSNPLLNRNPPETSLPANNASTSARHLRFPMDMDFMQQMAGNASMGAAPGEDQPAFLSGARNWVNNAENYISGARSWVNGAENYISGLLNALQRNGPVELMAHNHHHHHHHHPSGAVSFRIGGPMAGQGGDMMEILLSGPRPPGMPRAPHPHDRSYVSRSDVSHGGRLEPGTTMERWQEAARLIFGPMATELGQRLVNSILRLLVPPAIEAERVRKLKAAEEAKKREEERARLEAEREAQEKKEREEREAQEARERLEAQRAAARELEQQQGNGDGPSESMEGVETSETGNAATMAEEAPSAPAERVFTTIRGRQLDITDLGIDQTFLEELPEDMREEVIMQQFAEQRAQAGTSGEERADLNPQFREFLEAVPAEIREELLQQEAQDRRRREREEARRRAAANSGQAAQAEEMDAASFMASLDPVLRQSVLAEADEDTLANLPAELAAEARALGGHHRRRLIPPMYRAEDHFSSMGRDPRRGMETLHRSGEGSGRATRRPIVQMFDKAGVATLLRLMFVPSSASSQPNSQSSLHVILRNACGNHQTRSEVVSGLLAILQDGSEDASSVDRTFIQLTQRTRQSQTTKVLPAGKKPAALPWNSETAPPPSQILGNCLAALLSLTQDVAHITKFFLTEHETPSGLKAKLKGKGKAKDARAGKFPINDLLSLLSRDSVITNPQIVEQLASLLQIVTQPLNALLKKDKDESGESTDKGQVTQGESSTSDPQGPAVTSTADAAEAADSSAEANTVSAPDDTGTADQDASAGAVNGSATADTPVEGKTQEPKKTFTPPEIPEENLRLVINILTARECNAKSFRDTLSTINNLSAVPNAREAFGEELVQRARELGKSIQADLEKLTKDIQDSGSEIEAQNLALTKFSPTGSDQAKLNRILTALDYLFDTKAAENKNMSTEQSENLREKGDGLLTSLYEDINFSNVWNTLSTCLSSTRKALTNTQQSEKQSEQFFLHIATILLPLIESLMVVCKRLAANNPRAADPLQASSAPTTPAVESVIRNIFFSFTNTHKKILNDLVRQNPKLMSGSFSVLVKNSSVLEFDNKRNYFNRRLHQRTMDTRHYPHPSLQLNVRREQAFQDSYKHLYFKKPEEVKYGKLNIRFHNEEGVDAGGVTREWFQVLARQMFDPNIALFNPVAADQTTFHPNPLSWINDIHLQYFKFIGRIIGKALYENRVLDCHFSRAVYKRILGKSVSLKDMETIDLDYAKSLQWMLNNEIADIITETFSITSDKFGVTEVVDLVENGRNIPVTDENKHEYVRLMVEHKLTGSVEEQLESFLQGFHDIVSPELISIFDEGELELLISGMPEVDVDDWKANTDYHNYNASSPQIQWFWRAVRSFDKEERAKLLQFVTGTGKVPLNGFKELEGMNGYTRFSIHKDYGNKDRLPSSHTCFNQLDLPEYESYENLRKNLYTAMTTGGEYFGFA